MRDAADGAGSRDRRPAPRRLPRRRRAAAHARGDADGCADRHARGVGDARGIAGGRGDPDDRGNLDGQAERRRVPADDVQRPVSESHVIGVCPHFPGIAPGRYRAVAPSESCEWRRSPGGHRSEIGVVDIAPTDTVFISGGCGTWEPWAPVVQPGQAFGDGTYVVGAEIAPGLYRAAAPTESCERARLPQFHGRRMDKLEWPVEWPCRDRRDRGDRRRLLQRRLRRMVGPMDAHRRAGPAVRRRRVRRRSGHRSGALPHRLGDG